MEPHQQGCSCPGCRPPLQQGPRYPPQQQLHWYPPPPQGGSWYPGYPPAYPGYPPQGGRGYQPQPQPQGGRRGRGRGYPPQQQGGRQGRGRGNLPQGVVQPGIGRGLGHRAPQVGVNVASHLGAMYAPSELGLYENHGGAGYVDEDSSDDGSDDEESSDDGFDDEDSGDDGTCTQS